MSEFVTLMEATFSALSDFLISEPIIYFVGLFILCWIAEIFRTLITFK